jgi:hypothetical protein
MIYYQHDVIVERNHVNLKKAQLNAPIYVVFFEASMEFHRLSTDFYKQYGLYKEILTNEKRPYYVLL